MRRRLTDSQQIVSLFDEAYVMQFSDEQRDRYTDTLDIKELGNIGEMENKPVIFTVKPLMVKYEHKAYCDFPDTWGIFRNHVQSVLYGDELGIEWINGKIDDACREYVSPRVVQDIANQITALSNKTGSDYFFTPPGAALHFARRLQTRNAARRAVTLGAARTKPIV